MAVMNEVDAAEMPGTDVRPASPDPLKFAKLPVCVLCFNDPAHRVFPIKATFFPAADAENARQLAGERNAQGDPVRTP